jgi:hypothetical protein
VDHPAWTGVFGVSLDIWDCFCACVSVEVYTRSAKRVHDLVTIRYVRDMRLLIICMDFETGTIHSFSWDQFKLIMIDTHGRSTISMSANSGMSSMLMRVATERTATKDACIRKNRHGNATWRVNKKGILSDSYTSITKVVPVERRVIQRPAHDIRCGFGPDCKVNRSSADSAI